MNHTPGPWHPLNNWGRNILNPETVFGECGIVAEGSEAFIGQPYMASEKDLPFLDANLRLLSAAPEMLELLEYIRDYLKEMDVVGTKHILTDLHKIIAKARGEK